MQMASAQLSLAYFINTYSKYLIPAILFLGSFLIYSYNLEGQPWHGDEVVYLSWAGNYIDLINKGDFSNPCLLSLDNCSSIYHIPAYGLTYSPVRNLLIGYPLDTRQQVSGDFYHWGCYWQCVQNFDLPTLQEMTAGRLLSPLFGALTIAISFLIGKMFFNKQVGIIFSLLFLFFDLWLWYSRTIMTEVHYVFFSMLSFFLLLYAFKTGQLKIRYLVLSAITFGFALTSKMLSVEFGILFVGIILFGNLFKKDKGFSLNKVKIRKTSMVVLLFFGIAGLSFFLTLPGFYQDPLHQIALTKNDMDNYNRDVWYIGYPTVHNIQIKSIVDVSHYVFFPPLESLVTVSDSEPSRNSALIPITYSSIPMSIFFFVGLGYLTYRLKKFKNYPQEGLLLVWFVSTFFFTLLMAKDFSLERYLLPFLVSVIFIASYGFWHFINRLLLYKTKFVFSACFVITHSVVALSSWQELYFSPSMKWTNPLSFGTLQSSFDNAITIIVNSLFLGFLIIIVIIKLQRRDSHTVISKSTSTANQEK